MVRKKNVLATMAQSLAAVAVISILWVAFLWVAFGYSLVFVGGTAMALKICRRSTCRLP